MPATEIESYVSAIVAGAGVSFTVTARGATKRDEWECDAWTCIFSKGAAREEFEFFTGTGHRAKPSEAQKKSAWLPGLTEKDIKTRTIYGRRYLASLEALHKPVAPHVAGVLHSLVLDSGAARQSFADWCGDFGYDTDSRKAFRTYEACQESAAQLRRIFTHAQIDQLSLALQDY